LYGLHDLDRGKVVPLLGPTKVSHTPGNALSDELFRAVAAAAMTCLVERTADSRTGGRRCHQTVIQDGV
jgi:hypothetical protein